jgi:hypothetical protein
MCSTEAKNKAYMALVRPHLEYASAAWNPHAAKNINKIEQIQWRADRFALQNYNYSSNAGLTQQIQSKLQWPSLQHRRALTDLTLFYKIRNCHINMPFPSSVHPSPSQPHRYLHIQGLHSAAYHHSFYPRTIRLWNKIPQTITDLPTIETFSARVISHIYPMSWQKANNIWTLAHN